MHETQLHCVIFISLTMSRASVAINFMLCFLSWVSLRGLLILNHDFIIVSPFSLPS